MFGLVVDQTIIVNNVNIEDTNYIGRIDRDKLVLSLEEALYLVEKGKLNIDNKTIDELLQDFQQRDKDIIKKWVVFRDLRDRGLIVKSGLKFGVHFRVYDRGVNPYKEGSKDKNEHTKHAIHVYYENEPFSIIELTRFARLALNIRTEPILALISSENTVTYYQLSLKRL